jgi:glucose/arabinose dehydrogenase
MRGLGALAGVIVALGVLAWWQGGGVATPSVVAQPAPSVALVPLAGGFVSPLFVTHAGDSSGRLFVVEQGGTIRILNAGTVLPAPFLDVSSIIVTGGERGLLGLAFHPRYNRNGRFFVFYTAANGDNTLAEYRVSSDPNRGDPATGRVLFAIPDPYTNHNGGMIAFGPDGYLYIGTGDGGNGGDPLENGQSLQTLLGKILRIDVDGMSPYAIPLSNPFAARTDARREIWALGVRNPWRFSFDRGTGDLWIADVGQARREEVNFQAAGSMGGTNYGWDTMEGSLCFEPLSGCSNAGLTLPVAEYDHSMGCSVTGGYRYRGVAYPALAGLYFYGDLCSTRLWALAGSPQSGWQATELLQTGFMISSFGEDQAGELYLAGFSTGIIYRLTSTGTPCNPRAGCTVTATATATATVAVTATATACNPRGGCMTATATQPPTQTQCPIRTGCVP